MRLFRRTRLTATGQFAFIELSATEDGEVKASYGERGDRFSPPATQIADTLRTLAGILEARAIAMETHNSTPPMQEREYELEPGEASDTSQRRVAAAQAIRTQLQGDRKRRLGVIRYWAAETRHWLHQRRHPEPPEHGDC